MKKISLIVVAALFLIMSCSDEEPPLTRTQVLTATNWRITGAIVDGIEQSLAACETKNNRLIFKENGELKMDFGTEVCDDGVPTPQEGRWQFFKNDTEMLWELDGFDTRMKIIELEAAMFRVEISDLSPKTIYLLKPTE